MKASTDMNAQLVALILGLLAGWYWRRLDDLRPLEFDMRDGSLVWDMARSAATLAGWS